MTHGKWASRRPGCDLSEDRGRSACGASGLHGRLSLCRRALRKGRGRASGSRGRRPCRYGEEAICEDG
nr:MAG TPA: hypothetical protein [Caudoviricetes sp.]DAM78296.1 MAG TPA: hypothetical protein [Caudoviricetes sp.]